LIDVTSKNICLFYVCDIYLYAFYFCFLHIAVGLFCLSSFLKKLLICISLTAVKETIPSKLIRHISFVYGA